MENLFNRNFAVFAVLALVVIGGFFFFKGGDEAAPSADNSSVVDDQAAAVETVPVVDEGATGVDGAVAE